MSVSRGWTRGGKPVVKLTCSAFIDADEYDRIMRIAKKQGWNSRRASIYIAELGWEVFTTSFFTCGEEYNADGSLAYEGFGVGDVGQELLSQSKANEQG